MRFRLPVRASARKNKIAILAFLATAGIASRIQHTPNPVMSDIPLSTSAVLATEDVAEILSLYIDLPTEFSTDVVVGGNLEVVGELTAPNVIYTLTAGDGISVTAGQNPTISLTDPGSAQNIFKTVKVGDATFDAANNTDTLEFAGTGSISVSADTTNRKVTIGVNASDLNISGFTDGGTNVYLTDTSDVLGLGTNSPSYKLHVVGTGYFSDDLTLGDALAVVGATSLTGDLTANGAANLNGNVTLGDATTDTITFTGRIANGTTILPDTDLGSDLGSATHRFNNLWVANINSNSSQSFSGQTTFSYEPQDTTYGEASVIINPTDPVANGYLLGLGVAGFQRAGFDEDGDVSIGYSDAIDLPTSDDPLNVYGHSGTRVAYINTDGDMYLAGNLDLGGTIISGGGSSFTGNITMADDTWIGLGASGGRLIFDDQATDRLSFMNTNVGIGTTTPGYSLEVAGNARIGASGTNAVLYFPATTSGFVGKLETSYASNTIQLSIDAADSLTLGGSGSGAILRNAGTNLSLYTDRITLSLNGLGELMRLTNTGLVGIGTTSPALKLQVSGSNNLPATSGSVQTGIARLRGDGTGVLDFGTVAGGGAWLQATNADNLSANYKLLLNPNGGNVGIGTITPTGLLHVDSTSTTFPTNGMGYFNWSPTAATTTTGDLFAINLGANGNVGSLFNITDNGSSLFKITESKIINNLPAEFAAAGDVSFGYDLVLTNDTAGFIRSYSPLYIESGDDNHNHDLNLMTYGTGNVIAQMGGDLKLVSGDAAMVFEPITAGDTRYWIGLTEDAGGDDDDLFQIGDGSVPGTNPFITVNTSGNVGIGTTSFGTDAAKVLALGNATAPSTSIADGIQLWAEDVSSSSELRVRDEAGNVTTLSPHNFELLGGPSEPLAWSYHSERDNLAINADITCALRLVEQMTGQKIIHVQDKTTGLEVEQASSCFTDNSQFSVSNSQTNSNDPVSNENSLITENLSAAGDVVLGDTIITGSFDVGTLQFNGLENSINAVGKFKIQPLALDDVEFLGGKVVFSKEGNVNVEGVLSAQSVEISNVSEESATVGTATLPAGKTSITIETTAVWESSHIFTSPKSKVSFPLSVGQIIEGESFVVETAAPSSKDIEFSWWIVNEKQ